MIREIPYKDRDEWLALRKKLGIGGSEAGSVIGLNPYKGAYTLWAEKTGKIPEFEGNLTTDVGSYLEEFIAKLFEKETGKKVRRKNRILVNDKYPFAFADVDRVVVGENAALEIKSTNSIPVMRKVRSGEYPEQWYCQETHYNAVGEFDRIYLAVLINCREFKIFVLDRDEAEIAALMGEEEKFWQNVVTNTPPAVDGLESTAETISSVYPDATGDTVDLCMYQTKLAQYIEITEQIKILEGTKQGIANDIKAILKDATFGETSEYVATWKNAEKTNFDFSAFAADNPDIDLDKYYKISRYRTFKIKKKQKEN